MHRTAFAALALFAWSSVAGEPASSGPLARDHVTVELVAEHTHVAPGGTLLVGLRLDHEEHWHTYWTNPGDSGLGTRIEWTLPDGVTAGPILWPAPHRLLLQQLTNFGYDGEILLPVEIRVPESAAPGTTLALKADASWLICMEECIPGDATLTLAVNVAAGAAPRNEASAALFDAARAAWPQRVDWTTEIADAGKSLVVTIADAGALAGDVELFPVPTQVFASGKGDAARVDGDLAQLTYAKSDYFVGMPDSVELVLVAGDERRAYAVTARRSDGSRDPGIAAPAAPTSAPLGILAAIAFAFLGGLLLNLMPCVFPVLALKALSLADTAHERTRARRDALAYLAGVVASFVALAATLLALRSAGAALGWGFQLQVPWVIGALALILFATGLSLSGVFAIGGAWMGAGQSLTAQPGARGAFFTGVLAVVVASPCTAPFMGPALGYAVTQPVPAALAVFLALALGLAAPLVALAYVPALARVLPKPGAWMETFKQALAFPMYLTALWLLWVLGRQTGADGMTQVLAGALALAFALWLAGRGRGGALRALVVVAGVVAAGFSLAGLVPQHAGETASEWEPYSAARLAALREEGRPVLVNMTADWCITCLANERAALGTEAVQNAIERHGVARVKGDWTHQDAAITAYLAQFGRNGVPLYVLYPRSGGEPAVLPQILTPALVLDALDGAATTDRRTK